LSDEAVLLKIIEVMHPGNESKSKYGLHFLSKCRKAITILQNNKEWVGED
jgi:hypothetical protein